MTFRRFVKMSTRIPVNGISGALPGCPTGVHFAAVKGGTIPVIECACGSGSARPVGSPLGRWLTVSNLSGGGHIRAFLRVTLCSTPIEST